MNIRDYRSLRTFASQRLRNAPAAGKVALIFAVGVVGLAAVCTLLSALLDLQIANSGGLGNLSTRTTLSALQNMLPVVQEAVLMCLELGFVSAMLRVARGQYVSPNSLRLGFARFWVLLRVKLLRGLILLGVAMLTMYAAMTIYLLTPMADPMEEALAPLMSQSSLLTSGELVIDEATYDALVSSLLPMLGICGLVCVIAVTPMTYSLRMAEYIIIDQPGKGALAAIRESRKMTRRQKRYLFLLDLKQWYYYLALAAASLASYGDVILPMLGVSLPVSDTAAYYLAYAVYLALLLLLYRFLRPRVDVVYALAYDALRPQEPTSGVALGNIFQM